LNNNNILLEKEYLMIEKIEEINNLKEKLDNQEITHNNIIDNYKLERRNSMQY